MTRGLVVPLAIASNIIISRALGPSINGSYRIILLIVTVASLIVTMGLGSANVYYGAREPDRLPELTGNSFLAAIGLGIAGIAAVELLTLLPAFQGYLLANRVDIRWVRGLVLLLPLVQLRAYLVEIIRAQGDILRYNLVAFWQAFVGLASAMLLVWILKQQLRGAVFAWALSMAATALLTAWLVMRGTGTLPKIDLPRLRASLSYGTRLHLGNIAQFLNYRLDIFFVGLFTNAAAVGFYATATALAEVLWEIPHAIRTVLLYQVAAGDASAAATMTARVSRVVLILMGGICRGVALASNPVIRLFFGDAYLPAAPALIALMPGIWMLSAGKLLATHLSGTGRPEVGTWAAAVSLIATILLDIFLIPRLGILGASIASSASYSLSALVILFIFLKVTGLRLVEITVIRLDDIVYLYRVFRSGFRQRTMGMAGPGANRAH
jgi:O-antigen/teichoic acid export membrane protein